MNEMQKIFDIKLTRQEVEEAEKATGLSGLGDTISVHIELPASRKVSKSEQLKTKAKEELAKGNPVAVIVRQGDGFQVKMLNKDIE